MILLSFSWFWFSIDLCTITANHSFICHVRAFPTNGQLAFVTLFWSFVIFAFLDLALPSLLWYCCSFEVIITLIIFSWGMIIASLFIELLQLHFYLKNKITSNNLFSRDFAVLYWCIYGSQIQRFVKKRGQAIDVIQHWLNILRAIWSTMLTPYFLEL